MPLFSLLLNKWHAGPPLPQLLTQSSSQEWLAFFLSKSNLPKESHAFLSTIRGSPTISVKLYFLYLILQNESEFYIFTHKISKYIPTNIQYKNFALINSVLSIILSAPWICHGPTLSPASTTSCSTHTLSQAPTTLLQCSSPLSNTHYLLKRSPILPSSPWSAPDSFARLGSSAILSIWSAPNSSRRSQVGSPLPQNIMRTAPGLR